MTWKYALVKVCMDGDDDYCELMELYDDENGQYNSFCKARIHSIEELEAAYKDIKEDGINTWFYENGKFTLSPIEDKEWDWEPK